MYLHCLLAALSVQEVLVDSTVAMTERVGPEWVDM